MQYVLKTPLSKQDLAPLKAGDTVLLSGVVYTCLLYTSPSPRDCS